MTTETDKFAVIAGMSVTDFKNLVNTDLYGAFTKVMEGSKRSGTSATALAGIIKDLEIQGAGASEVFAKLGRKCRNAQRRLIWPVPVCRIPIRS